MIGIGKNNAQQSTVYFADNKLLDSATGAAVAGAYSTRLLRKFHRGYALKVRRSSDNTEQDIGFWPDGRLDEKALLQFVESNSGYVSTWYDQSGNGRNMTQATTALQPRIVGSGVIDRLGYTAPSASTLHSGTIVDLFVYDTTNDSDSGKWRNRCAGKSWTLETLFGTWRAQRSNEAAARAAGGTTNDYYQNTTDGKFYALNSGSGQTEVYRGSRSDFPERVAIVAETNRVVIYDLTQPGYPMWMVFIGGNTLLYSSGSNVGSVWAIAGRIYFGKNNGVYGLSLADFVGDSDYLWADRGYWDTLNIAQRNSSAGRWGSNAGAGVGGLANGVVNDIAAAVVPGAPINATTGLPVPTVAVATGGGLSVIHNTGSVVSLTITGNSLQSVALHYPNVSFDVPNSVGHFLSGYDLRTLTSHTIANVNSADAQRAWQITNNSIPALLAASSGSISPLARAAAAYASGGNLGLSLLKDNPTTPAAGMVANITTAYSSGWMVGDIRGAWLADTTAETIGETATETITNGWNFTTTTGWSGTNCTLAAVSSELELTNTAGASATLLADFSVTTVVGRTYRFSANGYRKQANGTVGLTVAGIIDQTLTSPSSLSDLVEIVFTATSTSHTVRLRCVGTNLSDKFAFNNVSCKLTTELVKNGTLVDGGTLAWTANTGASLSIVSGRLRVTNAAGTAAQALTTVVGRTYVVSMDAYIGTVASVAAYISNVASYDGTSIATAGLGAEGVILFSFVATATMTYIHLRQNTGSAGYVEFDNISVKVASPDRSVKNKGLVINGTLTKAAVASGAALVGFSGFSAANYLEQPYNTDLEFGTGDFCVMGWARSDGVGASTQSIINLRGTNGRGIRVGRVTSGGVTYPLTPYAQVAGALATHSLIGTTAGLPTMDAGRWMHIALTRVGNVFSLYCDGVAVNSTTSAVGDISTVDGKLRIGDGFTVAGYEMSMTMWRIGATAATAEQIAHIYRTELPLLQASAQCTLAGTSSAVTALAADDFADCVHVGTSWGRSTFRGLLRVSSEATAAGSITAISGRGGDVLIAGTSGRYTPAPTAQAGLLTNGGHYMASSAYVQAQPFTRASTIQFLSVTGSADVVGEANPYATLYRGVLATTLNMYANSIVPIKTGLAANDTAAVVEVYNGTSSVGSYNGNATAVPTVGPLGTGSFRFGSGPDGSQHALYGDLVVWNSAVSAADRGNIEQNLKAYWGTP